MPDMQGSFRASSRRDWPGSLSVMPWLGGILAAFGCLSPAHAQTERGAGQRDPDSFINQQRAMERRLWDEYDTLPGDRGRTRFEWGGWYNWFVFQFDDGVESSRTIRRHDLRLWGRLSLERGTHEFYVRGRASLLDFNTGDSYDGNDDDSEGPNLERGVYRFDLARAMANGSTDRNLVVTAGRDLVYFGEGLALATTLDHVAVTASFARFEWTALAGKTIGSTDDVDRSAPTRRTRRTFLGGQARFTALQRHEPFVYALWQRDRNREEPAHLRQEFDYDSFYFGLGSSGELAPRLRYSTEWVVETGHSFSHREVAKDNNIRAWAGHALLEYLFPGERRARASIEYLFGSGDSDRFASPTDAIGGNRGDHSDNSFIGFGYRDTGLAFAPTYANLHMWRAGGSLFPWPDHARLGKFQLGADVYLFHKHHRAGAVSDPTARVGSGYLGWEADWFANWQMSYARTWTARFGAFFPGDAFADRTPRTFALVGLTWSF